VQCRSFPNCHAELLELSEAMREQVEASPERELPQLQPQEFSRGTLSFLFAGEKAINNRNSPLRSSRPLR
jgi:hypothetical protein